jgi:hypothetical protein
MNPQVGAVVSASCSECRDSTDVEVAAVVGDEIVSVTCKACGTAQRYRAPAAPGAKGRPSGRRVIDVGMAPADPRPRPRGGRRPTDSGEISMRTPPREAPPVAAVLSPARAPIREERADEVFKRWDTLTAGLLSRHGRPHRAHETYKAGEVILHNVHGMGVIEQISADGELTVLFRRGVQRLPSGRTRPGESSRP